MNQQPNSNLNNNNQYQNQPYTVQMPVYPIKNTKNKFLTFVFSLMPGVGQMYQGLMRRGVSMMALFFGVIAISVLLYLPAICFALPIIWFYSFFDVMNRSNYSIDELKAVKDSYILNLNLKPDSKLNLLLKNKHLFIGWIIVIIGVYALFNSLVFNNWYLFNTFFEPYVYDMVHHIASFIPKLMVPIICLIIGVKLIKGTNKNQDCINQFKEGQNDENVY